MDLANGNGNGHHRGRSFPDPFRSAHFLGICGSGMKPLAQALLRLGFEVSGTDPDEAKGAVLRALGAVVYTTHSPENIGNPDAVIYSTAIAPENPELLAAHDRGLPVRHRSDLLAWFLGRQEPAVVAGTHGKTTTTAMLTLLLERAGMDPWSFVGGHVPQFGGNFRAGAGRLAIAEADESDGSFLCLPRRHAILTNMEPEHLNYWGDEASMEAGYEEFIGGIPADGTLVACMDDPGVCRLLERRARPHISYGREGSSAEYEARNVHLFGLGSSFDLTHGGRCLTRVRLGVPGAQNVMNALGAFALAGALGADPEAAGDALADFHGVDRRFTRRVGAGKYLVIDDYAHHPTEIRATIGAANLLARERGGRLITIFQPHRYTRTQACLHDFGPAFAEAGDVLVTEIHAAGEAPVDGLCGEVVAHTIAAAHNGEVSFIPGFDGLQDFVTAMAKEDDIVLLLGAGSITKLATLLSVATDEAVPVDGGLAR